MSNIEVYAPLVDGGLMPFHGKGDSCSLLIESILGDDFAASPSSIEIKVETASGKVVTVIIPNDPSEAIVRIDGELI
jgi:hypothetical protein